MQKEAFKGIDKYNSQKIWFDKGKNIARSINGLDNQQEVNGKFWLSFRESTCTLKFGTSLNRKTC